MKEIEQFVSPLVAQQFPEFYKEEGPRFVDFVKQYYVWMEQENQSLNASRSLLNIRDIDKTSEKYLKYFKDKYLKNVPLTSQANTRTLVKNASELYKLKGTEAGIQLLIQGLYDEEASVYLPGEDVLKPSDGVWVKPTYLEFNLCERTKTFVGREILGNKSGAKAFLESLVRRRIGGRYIDVAYLSNVRGTFETGEYVTTTANVVLEGAPIVIGSLTNLTVITGGADFNVGDIFDVTSGNGKQGKARVTSISNETGKVTFTFINAFSSGGWGYNTSSEVLISDKVLVIKDIKPDAANTISLGAALAANIGGFNKFETVVQTIANVSYSTAKPNNNLFAVGAVVENYYNGNGYISGNGTIVSVTKTTDTTGYILVAPNFGNLISSDTTFEVVSNGSSNSTGFLSDYPIIFNASSGVDDSTDIITATKNGGAHGLSNGDIIRYVVAAGNTAISGLASGNTYFVVNAVSSGTSLQLSSTPTGTPINITHGSSETGHRLQKVLGIAVATAYNDRNATGNVVGSNTSRTTLNLFNTRTGVANATDVITTSGIHQLSNNDCVYLYVFGSVPSGLTNRRFYYVNKVSNTSITLKETTTGSNIDLTSTATAFTGMLMKYGGHLGVLSGTYPFIVSDYAPIVGVVSNTQALVSNTGTGTGAGFSIGSITDVETVRLSPDFISSNNTQNVKYAANSSVSMKLTGNNSGAALQYASPVLLSSGDYANGGFGFPKFPASNLDSTLLDCLRFDDTTIGSIASIVGINPGNDYNLDPFVTVLNPYVAGYDRHDYKISANNVSGTFIVGEQIQQSLTGTGKQLTVNTYSGTAANGTSTTTVVVGELVYQSNSTHTYGAKGFVIEAGIVGGQGTIKLANVTGTFIPTVNNLTKIHSLTTGGIANVSAVSSITISTTARALIKTIQTLPGTSYVNITAKRINLENTFQTGVNILGRSSGATANLVWIDQDTSVPALGLNANITANVQTSNNVATGLSVVDSGFGYVEGETVTLTKADSNYEVTAYVSLNKQGVGMGFYKSTKGFLDADKKIHDGNYYQEYSYEVQTKIPFDQYFDVLKAIMHVAGTKAFGKVSSISTVNTQITVTSNVSY